MAAPTLQFIGALYRYGKESDQKKQKLIQWKDAALESIAEGNGGDLASGSGNGLSFTKQIGGMTNVDWFNALDQALQAIDAGAMPPTITFARII